MTAGTTGHRLDGHDGGERFKPFMQRFAAPHLKRDPQASAIFTFRHLP